LTNLQSRYTDLSVGKIVHKACFLDPRFKCLSFLLEETKQSVMVAIKEEATIIANLAATKEERKESELEEPAPKGEPEVRANPEEHAKMEVKNIYVY